MNSAELRPSHQIRPFPNFTRPSLEGYFSVDEHREFNNSMKNLKYLKIPANVKFDLNKGDDVYCEKLPSADEEKLDHVLKFIMQNKSAVKIKPDFVCFRGLLTVIMNTPYEEQEHWVILATKFKNTIFLCKQRTEEEKAMKRRLTERDKKFMRYGFKFEGFIFSDNPSSPAPGSSKPVNESEEFSAVFKTTIEGKKILYAAETDGVISNNPIQSLEELKRIPMVEVKVKRRENNDRQLINFYKHKARKWWLQSFLVGIDSIHVGLRSDDGIVDEVQRIPLKQFSDEAKRNDYWHGTVSMNFLNDFLNAVSRDMRHVDNPDIVFRYQWDPQIAGFITCDKFEGTRYTFLSTEFIRFMDDCV